MKLKIRRIAAGVIILSFFLPWFDIWLAEVSGFTFMLESLGLGSDFGVDELIIVAFVMIGILLTAIWTVIQPKLVPTILLLVISTSTLIAFFSVEELAYIRDFGINILALGLIGIYVSLFVKDEAGQPMSKPVTAPQQNEFATTIEEPAVATASVKKFCSGCGSKLNTENKFCKDCGAAV